MSVVLPRAGRGCYHGNREAIRLYREILKATRLFHWCNEKGEPWGRILRESSRKEFEQARHETASVVVVCIPQGSRLRFSGRGRLQPVPGGFHKPNMRLRPLPQAKHSLETPVQDPLVVARLLVVGRQCLNDTIRGLEKTERRIADKITETRSR
ncbi:conserved unknown protein [Ectocarpus siliculosus]|uniref:Uncharacterized protein n=1 Tax=Ectocarpus siliculosus TaxID=2880 RepID=D8LQ13_ECTSI|nr:conserved unknown protein [Ectocarpus siliculosus]|eukprot:CBN74905.1 conserved unknown protein [Ectocarpus siliculosus]